MTLQDLSRIEQALTKALTAMYHQRIKYSDDNNARRRGGLRELAEESVCH